MTKQEQLSLLRAAGDFGDTDSVLYAYLDLAGSAILNRIYPFQDTAGMEVPVRYQRRQVEIAVVLLNKRGVEGENHHTENGIARQYEGGYIPHRMLADIAPFVGVISG